MKLNSIFSFFLPKESTFFPLFEASGKLLSEAGTIFIEFVKTTDIEERRNIYKRIKETEKKGDGITNELFEALNDTFVTPFDREDIRMLADALDDVLDYINGASKRIVLYNPEVLPQQAFELVDIIQKGCDEIRSAMIEFSSLKTKGEIVRARCSMMKELEREADDLYEHFMLDVFQMEKDAIELFKLTQIMKELERTTNCVNDVAKVLKTILIKYS